MVEEMVRKLQQDKQMCQNSYTEMYKTVPFHYIRSEGYVAQLPWWLIILLPGLVRPRAFQLAVNLAKIFERKYKSNWKV